MKKKLVYAALMMLTLVCPGCGPSKKEYAEIGREAFYAGRYSEAKDALERTDSNHSELLGVIYYWGLGVPQNLELAGNYLRRSECNEGVSNFCLGDICLLDAVKPDIYGLNLHLEGALQCYQKAKELGYESGDLDTRIDILSRILEKNKEEDFDKYSYAGGHLGTFFFGYDSEWKGGQVPNGWAILYYRSSDSYTLTFGFWKNGSPDGEALQVYTRDDLSAGTYVGYPMVGTY